MRIALQPAFILHRQPYRDTSLLLEILSWDYGRIGLVARGVRTSRSRLKGLLQPFTALSISWVGKGELMTVAGVEEADGAIPIPSTRLISALYANELLLRLLPRRDPHPALFTAYRRVLEDLSVALNEEVPLRIFEKRLLAELGYGLMLDTEALTGLPICPGQVYRYVLERGPVADGDEAVIGIRISGQSLLGLRDEVLDDAVQLRETKRLTRAAIGLHLEGRPLKTRELLINEHRRRGNKNVPSREQVEVGEARG